VSNKDVKLKPLFSDSDLWDDGLHFGMETRFCKFRRLWRFLHIGKCSRKSRVGYEKSVALIGLNAPFSGCSCAVY